LRTSRKPGCHLRTNDSADSDWQSAGRDRRCIAECYRESPLVCFQACV